MNLRRQRILAAELDGARRRLADLTQRATPDAALIAEQAERIDRLETEQAAIGKPADTGNGLWGRTGHPNRNGDDLYSS